MVARCDSSACWDGDEPATQIVLLFLLPFASYLIAEHIGVSGILAAVAAGMTITRSGVMRRAPPASGPGILETSLMAAEIDPNVRNLDCCLPILF